MSYSSNRNNMTFIIIIKNNIALKTKKKKNEKERHCKLTGLFSPCNWEDSS